MFEHAILPAVTLFGLCAVVVYGYWTQRREELITVRGDALAEAARALQSLADTAMHASNAHLAMKDMHNATIARGRHYYFDRAASIVRSIPVDRV